MVSLTYREWSIVCLGNAGATIVISNSEYTPQKVIFSVGLCEGKILDINVQLRITVHVENALISAAEHGCNVQLPSP